MKEILPSVEIVDASTDIEDTIEQMARICYRSEDRHNTNRRYFLETLIKNGHMSVFEHGSISVKIVTDRGITHELVRHRIASFSQESSRYCNYGKKNIEFIRPVNIKEGTTAHLLWEQAMIKAECIYKDMLAMGVKPENARSVLPNSLATTIGVTANPREWIHIFKLRTSNAAHPDIRLIMNDLLVIFKREWPIIFGGI